MEFALDKDFDLSEKDMPNLNENKSGNNININSDKKNENEIGNNSSKNAISLGEGNTTGTNNILDELKKEDMNNEIKGADDNNLNDSFENKLDYNLETNNDNSNKNINLVTKNSIKFTNKTRFLEKMKLNFDIYSNDYFDHFIKKVSDQIIKDYKLFNN